MGKVRLRERGGSGLKPAEKRDDRATLEPWLLKPEVSGTGEDADKPSLKEKRESVHVFRGLEHQRTDQQQKFWEALCRVAWEGWGTGRVFAKQAV